MTFWKHTPYSDKVKYITTALFLLAFLIGTLWNESYFDLLAPIGIIGSYYWAFVKDDQDNNIPSSSFTVLTLWGLLYIIVGATNI